MNELVKQIGEQLVAQKMLMATAESCTGGWIAQEITAMPGSSGFFDFSCVTYSNESKQKLLNVSAETLADNGAVSEAVVAEMAEGLLEIGSASIGVATSGIAGPGGGSEEKPVGTVCFGWAQVGKKTRVETKIFSGDRESVRKQAVNYALQGILQNLSS